MNPREEKMTPGSVMMSSQLTDGCVFIRRAPGLKTLTVMQRSSG